MGFIPFTRASVCVCVFSRQVDVAIETRRLWPAI